MSERIAFDQPDDTREFGPAHDICRECGVCLCSDCDADHDMSCSHHSEFYEPDVRDVEPDEVSK
jgi:hypothetical protein